ncbi:hypothetical protein BV22DRAFT_1047468 [Leucogyrophana mollusca]|uniref:Uncharacterized protein n=1 Tax=Leucogyrophana mollusca TaxID=85980 RepID=A0ACB8BI25_9AGAM|nr:hypothetical protein BV22DRAFT_1047468 [Leucogyrophana mollusca]
MSSTLAFSAFCSRGSNSASVHAGNPSSSRTSSPMASTTSIYPHAHGINIDHVLRQFRKLSVPSYGQSAPAPINLSRRASPVLGTPFALSARQHRYRRDADDDPCFSNPFADTASPVELSPSSSSSSDYGMMIPPAVMTRSSPNQAIFDAFVATRSRVLRLHKQSHVPFVSLVSFFLRAEENDAPYGRASFPPVSVWTLRDCIEPNDIWAVFRSHEEACAALSLSRPSITVAPALESDLESFEKLRRLDFPSKFPSPPHSLPGGQHILRMSLSTPDLHRRAQVGASHLAQGSPNQQNDDFVISSNPPNPRTTFRLGDWICNSPSCAAHNFGRNLACRGCGCPRSENQMPSLHRQGSCGMQSTRLPASPRFVNGTNPALFSQCTLPPPPASPLYPSAGHNTRHASAPQPALTSPKPPPSPSHPLLTPSGRAFAVGGKVHNVSTDPLTPCIMYWPDNEPFPEQGQIRPSGLMGVPQPPILNTGNRGPIEHQPGDWICLKCNYLNWRRRKVCQTCFPYAEGNGDSISAAVQAERIALLTSVLSQNQQLSPANNQVFNPPPASRSHSMTPPQRQRQFMELTSPPAQAPYRSQSHCDLGTQYADTQFIYQTSGPRRSSSSFPSMGDLEESLPTAEPTPLLPSFLQDIVQSPTLSPTSTSSADLSIEEYDDGFSSPGRSSFGRDRLVATNDSSTNLPLNNIWRLNDEETKGISGIALPNHVDLMGSRKGSHEILRRQPTTP